MRILSEWIDIRFNDFKNRKQGRGERPRFKCPICHEECKSIRYVSREPKELMDKFVRLKRKHIIP